MSLRYPRKGKKWTVQEEDIILSMFHSHTIEDIANILKRPPHRIIEKMHKMGISVKKWTKSYYDERFEMWLKKYGYVASENIDMETLREIFDTMDDEDK